MLAPQTEFANFDIPVKVHENALFHTKYLKNVLGMGHSSLPKPQPRWGGIQPLFRPYSLGTVGSWSCRLGALSSPHSKNPGYVPAWTFDKGSVALFTVCSVASTKQNVCCNVDCKRWFVLQRWLCCGPSWQLELLHVGIGGLCLLAITVVVCVCEHQLIASIRTEILPLLRRHKPSVKAKEL